MTVENADRDSDDEVPRDDQDEDDEYDTARASRPLEVASTTPVSNFDINDPRLYLSRILIRIHSEDNIQINFRNGDSSNEIELNENQ